MFPVSQVERICIAGLPDDDGHVLSAHWLRRGRNLGPAGATLLPGSHAFVKV